MNLCHAELQVTEVLINPRTSGDVWEFIEIRNAEPTEVDLRGYYAARLDDLALSVGAPPSIDGNALQSVAPARGIAVLYAANLSGTANDYRDDLFRSSWSLSPSATVIGVSGFPDLTNTGTKFGFWPNRAAYDADLVDAGGGVRRVGKFDHAAFSFDFRMTTLPSEGASFRWNGMESYQDLTQWQASAAGQPGVVTSAPQFLPGTTVGSPGAASPGSPREGLLITEVMYNPADPQPTWEWIEILNNTGALIDFAATPHVFDDGDGAALTGANITSGSVAQGDVAVLYNASLTPAVIQAAWDPGGTQQVQFIPVSNFSGLNNGGDVIGIWSSFSAYTSEAVTGSGRTMANAETVLAYSSRAGATGTWPTSTSGRSIYLNDVSADASVGNNWALSASGVAGAFLVSSSVAIYSGGDVGEPGAFAAGANAPGDFNGDRKVDGADLQAWEAAMGVNANADADQDGDSDGDDFLAWQRGFDGATPPGATQAVPEPTSRCVLALAALACWGVERRIRRTQRLSRFRAVRIRSLSTS